MTGEKSLRKLDAVLDIKFPRDADADSLNVLIDALATTAVAVVTDRIPGQRELAKPPLSAPQRHHEDEGHHWSLFDAG
jgi:mitochondrial distribution and morphology protein 31